ncbi:polyferredoxin [Desulfitispora alkaliphila]|uniref:4Fe-4S binding protein n=1 Tax=Desulfitispora alkaliphila TaxID=622674 RepID=UPI003D1DB602
MTDKRKIVQVISLIVFTALVFMGKMQLWLFIIGLGLITTIGLGRLYCGWFCPINTVMMGVEKIKGKVGKTDKEAPDWVTAPALRWGLLAVTIGWIVFSSKKGLEANTLVYLIAIGAGISFIYSQRLWHRFLCPFGTLFTIPARFSLFKIRLDQERCVSCNFCSKVCLGEAISIGDKQQKPTIDTKECLECFECLEHCPKKAIFFSNKMNENSFKDNLSL